MELINRTISIPTPQTEVKIVAMGCIHHGHAGCNERLAQFWYDKILRTRDTYCILGGDLVDSIFEKDKRYSSNEVAQWCKDAKWNNADGSGGTLMDRQFNYALAKWRPLAEAGKILWMHEGNHEQEIRLRASRDMTREWAYRLNVPYAGYSAHVNLIVRIGKAYPSKRRPKVAATAYRVKFYTTHGSGSAQTHGAKMNKVAAMMDAYDADVSLMWHLHDRMHRLKRSEGIGEPRGGLPPVIRNRDRLAAMCGTFLDRKRGVTNYGERKGFAPIVPGPSVIHLRRDPAPNERMRKAKPSYAPGTRIWISDAIVDPWSQEVEG